MSYDTKTQGYRAPSTSPIGKEFIMSALFKVAAATMLTAGALAVISPVATAQTADTSTTVDTSTSISADLFSGQVATDAGLKAVLGASTDIE
ncbi:hypothetical protein [Nocardia arthritidis]|uniref:Uncharacterized protein n=1 Tax=Nocardia arthritidis TaxID=228602 RepID=A0A6G9YLA9_9NOCA|nr:hypothetical protein [Nocardia arthritidis]QIS14085.1 hypothetical protein F5544_31215 [Nocardia arthritidis]